MAAPHSNGSTSRPWFPTADVNEREYVTGLMSAIPGSSISPARLLGVRPERILRTQHAAVSLHLPSRSHAVRQGL